MKKTFATKKRVSNVEDKHNSDLAAAEERLASAVQKQFQGDVGGHEHRWECLEDQF